MDKVRSDAYLGIAQTSKVERLARIVSSVWPLSNVAKLSISDVCGNPGYTSAGDIVLALLQLTLKIIKRSINRK